MKVIKWLLIIIILLVLIFFIGYLCVSCSHVNSDPDVTEMYDALFYHDDNNYVYIGYDLSGNYFKLEAYSNSTSVFYSNDLIYEEGIFTFYSESDSPLRLDVTSDAGDQLYYKDGKIYLDRK